MASERYIIVHGSGPFRLVGPWTSHKPSPAMTIRKAMRTQNGRRTRKEELVWKHEWKSPVEFIEALEAWVKKYNNEFLPSALQYHTPMAWNNNIQRTELSCRRHDKWGTLHSFSMDLFRRRNPNIIFGVEESISENDSFSRTL